MGGGTTKVGDSVVPGRNNAPCSETPHRTPNILACSSVRKNTFRMATLTSDAIMAEQR